MINLFHGCRLALNSEILVQRLRYLHTISHLFAGWRCCDYRQQIHGHRFVSADQPREQNDVSNHDASERKELYNLQSFINITVFMLWGLFQNVLTCESMNFAPTTITSII